MLAQPTHDKLNFMIVYLFIWEEYIDIIFFVHADEEAYIFEMFFDVLL